jgi:galactokinase
LRQYLAPARVNLIGEHTDYSGGFVLPAAIDRGISLAARASGGVVRLDSAAHPGTVEIPAGGGGHASGWGRYVAAVVEELALAGRPAAGLDGHLTTDIPAGGGLSSSAALEVVLATALCDVAEFTLEPLELALLCQRAELRAVGVPCGIMDQSASILGRAHQAVLLDCASLAFRHVPLPPGVALVIIQSGVERQLETTGYAQRRGELEAGIAAIGGSLREVGPDDLDRRLAGVAEIPARRVRHVVEENARVLAVEAALTRAEGPDAEALGRLFAEGHASLRDLFEVSLPELDLLVALAGEEGAIAARMTGGGFGGAIVVLAWAEAAEALGQRVAERYAAQARGRRATPFVCAAAEGARRVS